MQISTDPSYFLHLNANRALNEQRQLKFDEMRIVNLETLYQLFARWRLNADKIYLLSLRRHKGLLSRSQENELLTNTARDTENSLGKVTMLVKLHFPEVNDFLEKVLEARSANAAYLLAETGQIDIQAFLKDQELFDRACENFSEAITLLPKFAKIS